MNDYNINCTSRKCKNIPKCKKHEWLVKDSTQCCGYQCIPFDATPSPLPINNTEPEYYKTNYEKWSSAIDSESRNDQNNNNCYSYALNKYDKYSSKPQPGTLSMEGVTLYGYGDIEDAECTCDQITKRMMTDFSTIYKVHNKNEKCKDGFHKIYLSVDPYVDYHFYTQERNGLWSHKLGRTAVSTKDNSNEKITDPYYSNRFYYDDDNTLYTDSCGYFCVQN